MFKVGKQLFTAEGPQAVRRIAALGPGVFLDLKFHDIPNTLAGAVRAAAALPGVKFLTVHTLGGSAMMRAAVKAISGLRNPPRLLGVTVLTSMDEEAMEEVGMGGPVLRRVVDLARLARRCGLDGVIASPHEVSAIRRACGPRFLVVTPGIRSACEPRGDQTRAATPADAIRSGADYLVVGRPVTSAPDPLSAAIAMQQEMRQAMARRRR
jgi:orotidine-5'-phosphate decarboxylase